MVYGQYQRLDLRQQMVLAPQLQQSLALLQAPTLELKALVEHAIRLRNLMGFVPKRYDPAVVEALAEVFGFQALAVGTEIAAGVPWMTSVDGEPVALALTDGTAGGWQVVGVAFQQVEELPVVSDGAAVGGAVARPAGDPQAGGPRQGRAAHPGARLGPGGRHRRRRWSCRRAGRR